MEVATAAGARAPCATAAVLRQSSVSVAAPILPPKESGVPALQVLPRRCSSFESVKESRSLSSGRLLGPDAIVHRSLAIAGLCRCQESRLSGSAQRGHTPRPTPQWLLTCLSSTSGKGSLRRFFSRRLTVSSARNRSSWRLLTNLLLENPVPPLGASCDIFMVVHSVLSLPICRERATAGFRGNSRLGQGIQEMTFCVLSSLAGTSTLHVSSPQTL